MLNSKKKKKDSLWFRFSQQYGIFTLETNTVPKGEELYYLGTDHCGCNDVI